MKTPDTVVNPIDTLVRSERFVTRTPFPFVIGRDLIGRVAAVGEGADHLVGERVWCNSLGHDGRQGAFAEYAVVPRARDDSNRRPDRRHGGGYGRSPVEFSTLRSPTRYHTRRPRKRTRVSRRAVFAVD